MSQKNQNLQSEIRPSGQNFSVDVVLAAHYGLEEAFLINHFQHWIRLNKTKNQNFIDGYFWTYQKMDDIAAHFPFLTRRQVKYAIESLIKKKVLKKGNFNKMKMDKTNWYSFVREDIYVPDIPQNSKNVYDGQNCPSMDKIVHAIPDIYNPIPISKLYNNKGNTYTNTLSDKGDEVLDLDLPFSQKKKNERQIPKKSNERKYPRSPEQQRVFEWLLTLGLNTNENTLSYWASKYSKTQLENAWIHLIYKMSKGYEPKNIGGFFMKLVKTEVSPITETCLNNKKFAEAVKERGGWTSLKIHDRFCCEESRPDYDLPYCIDNKSFKQKLEIMWDMARGRRKKTESPSYDSNYEENYDE